MKTLGRLKLTLATVVAAHLTLGGALGELQHRYSFETDPQDSVGSAHGTLINTTGNSVFENGQLTLGNDGSQGSNAGTGDYVDLPNGTISALGQQATIEGWITWQGGGAWQRIFDFGTSNGGEDTSGGAGASPYMFLTPNSGPGTYRFAYRTPATERNIQRPGVLPIGEEQHFAIVWDEATTTAELYLNGLLVARDTETHVQLANLNDVNNWLGRSQWPDTMFVGSYNEFRLYNSAMTELQTLESFIAGPEQVGGGQLGALQSVTVQGESEVLIEGTRQLNFFINYENAQLPYSPISSLTDSLALTSSDESVATIDANGLITPVSLGTFTVTAEFEGQQATHEMEVTPVPLPEATIAHRYDFSEEQFSTVLTDLVGNADGAVVGVFSADGTLRLDSSFPDYVTLPNGIISSHENASIEMWATAHDLGGNWQRFWDFGAGTGGEDPAVGSAYNGEDYLFLAARIGGNTTSGMRFAIREGGVENPVLETPSYPREEQQHVVVAYNYSGETVTLYLNGRSVASGTAVYPLTGINDINNWLGRSQWSGDAFADVTFDEFRIYDGVLSPLEVAVNNAAGPNTLVEDPGDFQSISLAIDNPVLQAETLPVRVQALADFANIPDVDVAALDEATFTSEDETVATVSADGSITPLKGGTTVITVDYQGQTATLELTVEGADQTLTVLHRYSFNEAPGSTIVEDLVGDADGTVMGEGAVFDGEQLSIPGGGSGSTAAYVNLPNYMISGLPAATTFEVWTTWNGTGPWQRIYDFGDNAGGEDVSGTGNTYLFLSPQSGPGPIRVAFTIASGAGENPVLDGSAPMPGGTEQHVILTYDSNESLAKLYLNGQRIDTEVVVTPLSSLNDINNWLGRSNWPDNFYQGSYNEFRIYEGAMSDSAAMASFQRGPLFLPGEEPPTAPDLMISQSEGDVRVFWITTADVTLESTSTLGAAADWQTVGAQVQTDGDQSFVIIVPADDSTEYFRLTRGSQ